MPIRTREDLIESHLSDDDIVEIIFKLRERVAMYGDVAAAKLLFEFKYGKNPEPPSQQTSLEELIAEHPLANVSSSE